MKKITLNDPETRSADLVTENREHLKTVFPDAFTEGKVDYSVLKQLLGGAVEEREDKVRPQLAWQAASPTSCVYAFHGYPTPMPERQRRLGHDTKLDDRRRQPGGAQTLAEELRW